MSSLLERCFELLTPDAWRFRRCRAIKSLISDDLDFVVSDEGAEEPFAHPLNGVPAAWLARLRRERVCLVITSADCGWRPGPRRGVRPAGARGRTAGGMLFIDDVSV